MEYSDKEVPSNENDTIADQSNSPTELDDRRNHIDNDDIYNSVDTNPKN